MVADLMAQSSRRVGKSLVQHLFNISPERPRAHHLMTFFLISPAKIS